MAAFSSARRNIDIAWIVSDIIPVYAKRSARRAARKGLFHNWLNYRVLFKKEDMEHAGNEAAAMQDLKGDCRN